MVEKKLQGSRELKRSLPYGALKKIGITFGNSETWVNDVISGRKKGNLLILECAEKISHLHELELEKQTEILNQYL